MLPNKKHRRLTSIATMNSNQVRAALHGHRNSPPTSPVSDHPSNLSNLQGMHPHSPHSPHSPSTPLTPDMDDNEQNIEKKLILQIENLRKEIHLRSTYVTKLATMKEEIRMCNMRTEGLSKSSLREAERNIYEMNLLKTKGKEQITQQLLKAFCTPPTTTQGEHFKRRSVHRVYEKHCRLTFLFILPSFKPVSLSLSRSPLYLKHPKQVFF